MKKDSVYKLIKYITAFFSIITIVCFVVQLARIYFGNLTPMFSRALVEQYLLQILLVIVIWLLCVVIAGIFSLFVNEKKYTLVKTTEEAKLKILESKLPDNIENNGDYQALVKCHKHMKLAFIISLVVYACCLIMVSLYLFNPSHFIYNGHINEQIIDMLINVGPWLIIAFITLLVYIYYVDYKSKIGVVYAKAIMKSCGKATVSKYKKMRNELLIINLVRLAIIIIAVIFIVVGVTAGGPQRVYQKAINICTECIGLG